MEQVTFFLLLFSPCKANSMIAWAFTMGISRRGCGKARASWETKGYVSVFEKIFTSFRTVLLIKDNGRMT